MNNVIVVIGADALVETATAIGTITGVIHAAGVSPTQASPATILTVDCFSTSRSNQLSHASFASSCENISKLTE